MEMFNIFFPYAIYCIFILKDNVSYISTNITLSDSDVWFGHGLNDVDWPALAKEMAPFLSFTDRYELLEISGTDGVSPALLLATAIYFKNEKKSSFKKQTEDISGALMNAFFSSTNRTKEQKDKENDATHGISSFVQNYSNNKDCSSCVAQQTNELVAILKAVMAEAENYQKTSSDMTSDFERITRGESEEESLRFPYKLSECWMLSATHHSNKYCSEKSCPKSSIDLAPNLFMGFGFSFEYFESEGEVTAAHSGTVDVISPCKVSVRSNKFVTYYSHINVTRRNGEYVRVGDSLGFIQLLREEANCNCEISAGDTECTTGPHLHWEVRDSGNKPIDLNNMIISGFVIHTGTSSYDLECGTEECYNNMTIEDIEQSCSTVYRRLIDNATFCPNKQGANWGMLLYLTQSRTLHFQYDANNRQLRE